MPFELDNDNMVSSIAKSFTFYIANSHSKVNYKCPNKCVFTFFGFLCDFLEFPSVKSSKIHILPSAGYKFF